MVGIVLLVVGVAGVAYSLRRAADERAAREDPKAAAGLGTTILRAVSALVVFIGVLVVVVRP